mmetsp:Transcript_2489/g.4167  ORF Transcript_2489/g.4167 Transcript_2489/m.4167 type:complete len:220 (-) Transcript_2489:280-939(-)
MVRSIWTPESKDRTYPNSASNSLLGTSKSLEELRNIEGVPHTPPSRNAQDKQYLLHKTGRFDTFRHDPWGGGAEATENFYHGQNAYGLYTPQSRRVGPMAGPDPYNVRSSSAFDFNERRRLQQWNSSQSQHTRPASIGGGKNEWLNANYNASTTRRPSSPLKKHPSVLSPTKQRYQKNIQDYKPLDLRSTFSHTRWGRPPKMPTLSMTGGLSNRDPFKR